MSLPLLGVFALFATRVLDTRVRCLNSPFVEAVQFVKTDGSKVTVYQCSSVRQFFRPVDLTLSQQKRIVQIEQLNPLSFVLPQIKNKRFLQITSVEPSKAKIDGSVLRLGEGVAASSSFQTNLIYFLLLETGRELETWTLSLYLTSTATTHHWIYDLFTSRQFCLEEPRLFSCEQTKNISPFGIASSIAFLLKSKERSLPLKKRIQFMRELTHRGIDLSQFDFSTLAKIQKSFNDIFEIKSFKNPLPFGVDLFDVLLKNIGALQKFSQHIPIVIFEKDEMTIWPTLSKLPRQKLSFDHLVLLTCQIPQLNEISQITSDRMTVIRHCEGEDEVNWQNVLLSEIPKISDSIGKRDEGPRELNQASLHHKAWHL